LLNVRRLGWVKVLRPLDTKYVISESFPAVISRLGIEKQNFTKNMGQLSNVMVALPNISGALCSTPQSLADAQY